MWNQILYYFWVKNQTSPVFGGRQKPLVYEVYNNKKKAKPILVLLRVVNNYCLAIIVAVIVWKNGDLNFCNDSVLKIIFLYLKGDKCL